MTNELELGFDKFLLGYQKAFHSSPIHSIEDFSRFELQFQGLSSGLIIIYPDKGFGRDNVEHDDIVYIIHNHTKCKFVNLFFGVYWPYYQVNIVQKNWEDKIEELNKKIMELSRLNDIQELYKKLILDYKDFESFCRIEDSNSKSFKEQIKKLESFEKHIVPLTDIKKDSFQRKSKNNPTSESFGSSSQAKLGKTVIISGMTLYGLPYMDRNVVKDFIKRNESLLEKEKINNEYFKSQFISIINYIKNFSDLKINDTNIKLNEANKKLSETNVALQKSVGKYTKFILILTFFSTMAVLFQLYEKIPLDNLILIMKVIKILSDIDGNFLFWILKKILSTIYII